MTINNDNKEKEKILGPWVGFTFIKRNTEKGILHQIWQDDPNDKDKDKNKDPANQWRLIKSWVQEPDNRPIWITWEEWIEDPDKWKGKNYHIKSKPTTGPYFLNDKGEICFTMTDEYDHMYTVRMDNPLKLNAEEATEMMTDLTKDIREEKEKEDLMKWNFTGLKEVKPKKKEEEKKDD